MLRTKFVLLSVVLITILLNVSIVKSQTLTNQTEADFIKLDKNRITLGCDPGSSQIGETECNDDMYVGVSTAVSNQDNKTLGYIYTVNGGQVIGQGANVSWNLTDLQPGKYTISVNVSDSGGNLIKTLSKSIEVLNCNSCTGDCVCPTTTINVSDYLPKAGSEVTFTANLSGGSSEDFIYNWTISKGEIINGQGTPTIRVSSTPAMVGQNITASIEIKSEICFICNRSESETIKFQPRKSKKKKVSKNVH